jgi:uncharacterized repeat protein (TIGR04138 family)
LPARQYYCYLHHAEDGYSDPLPEKLPALATRLGYPPNAVYFLAEAMGNNAKLCRNAMGCCIATWVWAERFFGQEAGDVLRGWGISSGKDIAAILFGLIECGILATGKEESPEEFSGLYTVGKIP